jgi:hypothetical protein
MSGQIIDEIKIGTVLTVLIYEHGEQLAIVNGNPYAVGITTKTKVEVIARIPCHLPETNENMDVAGTNVTKIGWP